MYYFYVLQSQKNKNWFYKGSTSNLRRRIMQHTIGEVKSSRAYIPLKLVYYEAYLDEKTVRLRERSIKKNPGAWTPIRNRIRESLER